MCIEEASRGTEGNRALDAVMTKKSSAMPFMKYTAKRFSQGIGWIDFSREMAQEQVTSTAPFLDRKPLDVDVASPFGGLTIVDYVDRGLVVFKNNSGTRGRKTKFAKNRADVATDLAGMDGGKELGFGRTSGNDGLRLHTVCNGCARHDKKISGS